MTDKLVELIAKYFEKLNPNSNHIIATQLAGYLRNNGVTVQQWIPVGERLPENGGKFLVCGSRGGIYTAELRNFTGYPHWHKLNSKSHWCEPTHWMPLPEPPKEGE